MKAALVVGLALFPTVVASAADVFLKGGGKVSGRILQKTDTSVEIDVGGGQIAVPMNRVEKIVEGRSAVDIYHQRAAALNANDREDWSDLGRWASDQGQGSLSREAFRKVLAIDPTDAEANAAVGNVQVNGRWMSEDEGNRARGYVQFEGDWMTPAEQAAIQSERAQADNERARATAEARARQAEQRADDAEARARAAEAAQQEPQYGLPLWYGWGPGPTVWPTQPAARPRPARGR